MDRDRGSALATADVDALREAALPLEGSPRDFDPLLHAIGEARLVLIGEASHRKAGVKETATFGVRRASRRSGSKALKRR